MEVPGHVWMVIPAVSSCFQLITVLALGLRGRLNKPELQMRPGGQWSGDAVFSLLLLWQERRMVVSFLSSCTANSEIFDFVKNRVVISWNLSSSMLFLLLQEEGDVYIRGYEVDFVRIFNCRAEFRLYLDFQVNSYVELK